MHNMSFCESPYSSSKPAMPDHSDFSSYSYVPLTRARKEFLLLRTCVTRLCVRVCMLSHVWLWPHGLQYARLPCPCLHPRVSPLALSLLLTGLRLCNFSVCVPPHSWYILHQVGFLFFWFLLKILFLQYNLLIY